MAYRNSAGICIGRTQQSQQSDIRQPSPRPRLNLHDSVSSDACMNLQPLKPHDLSSPTSFPQGLDDSDRSRAGNPSSSSAICSKEWVPPTAPNIRLHDMRMSQAARMAFIQTADIDRLDELDLFLPTQALDGAHMAADSASEPSSDWSMSSLSDQDITGFADDQVGNDRQFVQDQQGAALRQVRSSPTGHYSCIGSDGQSWGPVPSAMLAARPMAAHIGEGMPGAQPDRAAGPSPSPDHAPVVMTDQRQRHLPGQKQALEAEKGGRLKTHVDNCLPGDRSQSGVGHIGSASLPRRQMHGPPENNGMLRTMPGILGSVLETEPSFLGSGVHGDHCSLLPFFLWTAPSQSCCVNPSLLYCFLVNPIAVRGFINPC